MTNHEKQEAFNRQADILQAFIAGIVFMLVIDMLLRAALQ